MVFREERCPDDLKEYGEKCDGLPLAVVIIAGILLGKSETRLEWRNVTISFSDFLRMNIESYQSRATTTCLLRCSRSSVDRPSTAVSRETTAHQLCNMKLVDTYGLVPSAKCQQTGMLYYL
nr:putative late blight resistance protein homolog R1B-14 [Ipomoea batatas]